MLIFVDMLISQSRGLQTFNKLCLYKTTNKFYTHDQKYFLFIGVSFELHQASGGHVIVIA